MTVPFCGKLPNGSEISEELLGERVFIAREIYEIRPLYQSLSLAVRDFPQHH